MLSTSDKVHQLRQLLAGRFGEARVSPETTYLTGLPVLDEIGIPARTVTEIVSSPNSGPGGMLLLYGLLHSSARSGKRVVLVDGKDAFQPQGLPQADLQRLLWNRCLTAREALQATDLAARDGNFPLIILLLTLNPARELARISNTAWHRLHLLAEKSAAALLVFTPSASVGCARLRLLAGGDFPLGHLHRCRSELLPAVQLKVDRRRTERRRDDETVRRSACA